MLKMAIAMAVLSLSAVQPVLAEGDAKLGKRVFKKCAACHTVKLGKQKVGPSLYNIVDAKAASVEGYTKYSDALLNSGLTWDEATLRSFLKKPREVVPKTKMAFGGLKKEADLDNLMAYLKSVSAN